MSNIDWVVERDRLFAYAMQLTQDIEAAEDLTQDSILKIIQSLDNFEGKSNLTTWCHSIMHHTYVDGVRKAKIPQVSLEQLTAEQGDFLVDPEKTVLEKLIDNEQEAALIAYMPEALKQIPDAFMIPFEMLYMLDYSCDEVAERLNIPVATVRTRAFRAKRKLAVLLKSFIEQ